MPSGIDDDEELFFDSDAENGDETDLFSYGPINENDPGIPNPLHQVDEEYFSINPSTVDAELGMEPMYDEGSYRSLSDYDVHDEILNDNGISYYIYDNRLISLK